MFTEVTPEKAVEIENAFRAARTVGEFVAATVEATEALHPDNGPVSSAQRAFTAAINAAIVQSLGADKKLSQIPEVALLIEVHAGLTGVIDALIADKYAEERANETA